MALTDENGGIGATMLVGPTGYGGYPYQQGGGFGNGFGGDWAWIILLLLLGWGNNGWGNGGFGGNDNLYPWMNQANLTSNGFQNQMLNDNVTSIRDGIYSLSNQLCNCCGDMQMSLANGFAGVEQGANARQMANMQTAFAGQTAMAQGFNNLQSQLAQCCCDNRLASADLKYTIATENCADRAAVSDGIRDLLANQTANTQRILDQLCNDKIEQKNDIIAQLRSELMYARGQASQDVQTATIQAGQRALANEVEQYVLPTPRPAYIVQNPNCCVQNTCGCGAF